MQKLLEQAKNLGQIALQKKIRLATAESCTGGQIAYLLTSIPGSSEWFERGFVTYSNEAKQEDLNVPMATIDSYGAVSEETALAMARGVLENSAADMSVVTTGVAGPTGGTSEKPVGTVWIAWCRQGSDARAQKYLFTGDRLDIRNQACEAALRELKTLLQKG